ncbi:hypothetical protein BU24DRAFT_469573 [Aaosphaeria arxii CBS 175.79]|uniref:NAD(P)-binding domain-containing protein n=1 Tax=Aaosphaeria arxii CBS 175.79 TaxID=1450172 RepID=A0A6A5Y5F6_9PLEO|nr:uncharacterized protein BU24DRAFT_469573 [Aaosphaeria arxii CBS 175.79]KAF2020792.1 hypothetical protein BU24DRAFT_469573 [Aaosphaeria arxii CBS 175.79]
MEFKIVLTGVTGRIGSEVLRQCLKDPSITSVIALSRRPLPDVVQDPKLDLIVMNDFDDYSEDVLAKLAGAVGCVWLFRSIAIQPKLELDYPKAFANAMLRTFAQTRNHFRYVHVSGAMVERDQNKSLWLGATLRKLKGQGEIQALGFANNASAGGRWETFIARPGGVVKGGTALGEAAAMLGGGFGWAIKSDELALALIETVKNGDEELTLRPLPLVTKGRKVKAKLVAQ